VVPGATNAQTVATTSVGSHELTLRESLPREPALSFRFADGGPVLVIVAAESFEADFAVIAGSSPVGQAESRLGDDPFFSFEAVASETYGVLVVGSEGSTGSFTLHVVRAGVDAVAGVRALVRYVRSRAGADPGATESWVAGVCRVLASVRQSDLIPPFVDGILEAGFDDGGVPNLLVRVAEICRQHSEYDAADGLLDRAAAAANTDASRVAVLGETAQLRLATDRLGDARECLRQIQEIGPSGHELPVLETRARLAVALGERHAALRLRREILERREKDEGAPKAAAILNLGVALEEVGQLAAAVEQYEKSLERIIGLEDEHPLLEAEIHINLARSLRSLGRVSESVGHSERTLEIAVENEFPDEEAIALEGLGDSHRVLGQLRKAREFSARSLEKYADGLKRPVRELYPLETLALIALAEGRTSDVAAHLARTNEILDGVAVARLGSQEAAGVRSGFHRLGELAQDLAALRIARSTDERERRRAIREGFRAAGRWKARSLLQGMSGGETLAADAFEELRDGRSDDETLVEFAPGRASLYAYRLDARGLEHVRLGPRGPIESDVEEYTAGLSDREAAMSLVDVVRVGGALHSTLIEGVLDGPTGRTLTIVPSHALAGLPFDALVVGTHGSGLRFVDVEFLYEATNVVLAPSSPVLAHLRSTVPRSPGHRVLLVGDPVHGPEVGVEDVPDFAFQRRLPLTADEVKLLAKSVSTGDERLTMEENLRLLTLSERDHDESIGRYDILLGASASVGRIKEFAGNYALAHFACHGVADPTNSRETGLVLSWNRKDHGLLGLEEVARLKMRADLVVLSACRTARGRVLHGEGVQSIASAFLRAGSRAVLASLWNVPSLETKELMKTAYRARFEDQVSMVDAWRSARNAYRDIGERGEPVPTGAETLEERSRRAGLAEGHPYEWAAFVLVGAP